MSTQDHQITRDMLVEVHKTLLKAELDSCQKYIEVVMELTSAIKRFDEKYEKRINDLEEDLKRYIRTWG